MNNNPRTENNSQNPPRSLIVCKGRLKSTTLPCEEVLCETDGENLFVKVSEEKELILTLNERRQYIKCPRCKFETFWKFGMRGE